ncbi:MAG: beta-galactosidase [Alphaproteobacteria bacterium]|nr:beta-galactosidase [Alphaproteobacteria bacterium]
MISVTSPFSGFVMAGFESADSVVRKETAPGVFTECRLNMIKATQHDVQIREDYRRLKELGVKVVREGSQWPMIEQIPGQYDFSVIEPFIDAGHEFRIQQIFSFCHYGCPGTLDFLSPDFVPRFVNYSVALHRFIKEKDLKAGLTQPRVYAPINEPSFMAYAVDAQLMLPFAPGRGWEVKEQIVRAVIASMDAIWVIDPDVQIVNIDPILNVVSPRGRPDVAHEAKSFNELQYETWDMLCGRKRPELGGAPKYLGIIGANLYHNNQIVFPPINEHEIPWHIKPRDDRWLDFSVMLQNVQKRYPDHALILSETSHFGEGRAEWAIEIIDEVQKAQDKGVNILGMCFYPIIDRYDWYNEEHYHNSGLWDYCQIERASSGNLKRVVNIPQYAEQIMRAVKLFDKED